MADRDDDLIAHTQVLLDKGIQQHITHTTQPTSTVLDCINCDEPIGEARRKAHPQAVTCIACERLREVMRQTRQHRGR